MQPRQPLSTQHQGFRDHGRFRDESQRRVFQNLTIFFTLLSSCPPFVGSFPTWDDYDATTPCMTGVPPSQEPTDCTHIPGMCPRQVAICLSASAGIHEGLFPRLFPMFQEQQKQDILELVLCQE